LHFRTVLGTCIDSYFKSKSKLR